jgi:hypothetical protein
VEQAVEAATGDARLTPAAETTSPRLIARGSVLCLTASLAGTVWWLRRQRRGGQSVRGWRNRPVWFGIGLAAEQGHIPAQPLLGALCADGLGVPQDSPTAARWWALAAEHGYASAPFNLDVLYANGLGVPQDTVLAAMWFTLAAAQRHEEAAAQREALARTMTPEPLTQAQRLARAWTPTRE